MKLIVAIVQDEDAGRLVSALMDKGFGVTKLATTGGFLRAGNTTLISGVEDDKLQDALGVIEKICKSREQITASTTPMGGAGGVYVPYPIRVTVGGATVFVLEVSQFLGFETITCAPIDLDAVIPEQMSPRQRGWLNDYHAFVRETLLPLMQDDDERAWLRHATRAI